MHHSSQVIFGILVLFPMAYTCILWLHRFIFGNKKPLQRTFFDAIFASITRNSSTQRFCNDSACSYGEIVRFGSTGCTSAQQQAGKKARGKYLKKAFERIQDCHPHLCFFDLKWKWLRRTWSPVRCAVSAVHIPPSKRFE